MPVGRENSLVIECLTGVSHLTVWRSILTNTTVKVLVRLVHILSANPSLTKQGGAFFYSASSR